LKKEGTQKLRAYSKRHLRCRGGRTKAANRGKLKSEGEKTTTEISKDGEGAPELTTTRKLQKQSKNQKSRILEGLTRLKEIGGRALKVMDIGRGESTPSETSDKKTKHSHGWNAIREVKVGEGKQTERVSISQPMICERGS